MSSHLLYSPFPVSPRLHCLSKVSWLISHTLRWFFSHKAVRPHSEQWPSGQACLTQTYLSDLISCYYPSFTILQSLPFVACPTASLACPVHLTYFYLNTFPWSSHRCPQHSSHCLQIFAQPSPARWHLFQRSYFKLPTCPLYQYAPSLYLLLFSSHHQSLSNARCLLGNIYSML